MKWIFSVTGSTVGRQGRVGRYPFFQKGILGDTSKHLSDPEYEMLLRNKFHLRMNLLYMFSTRISISLSYLK